MITRQERLFSELKIALAVTNQDDLRAWGTRSATQLPTIAKRRIKNLGMLLSNIASFTGSELLNAIRAIGEGRLGKHIGNRSAAAIDGSIEFKKRIENTVSAFTRALKNDPKSNAPGVLALAMGFLAGSGGVDANGGPDDDNSEMLPSQQECCDEFSENSVAAHITQSEHANSLETTELERSDWKNRFKDFEEFEAWLADHANESADVIPPAVNYYDQTPSQHFDATSDVTDPQDVEEPLPFGLNGDENTENDEGTAQWKLENEIHGLTLNGLLAEAVKENRIDICGWLFAHGATVISDFSDISLPISCAIDHNNKAMLEWLLVHCPDMGVTSLCEAWWQSKRSGAVACEAILARKSLEKLILWFINLKTHGELQGSGINISRIMCPHGINWPQFVWWTPASRQ